MPVCASCSAQLQPEWKFCIYCGTPAIPGAIRPEPIAPPPTNRVAILALTLAAIGGAPALVFGHIAMVQILRSGERGMLMARIATVLGYVWFVVTVVLIATYLNAH
jgi:hypothetical protein